jgi:Flp pilus assembly protein CpaB
MTYRLKNIVIAVALALVAGLLTVFYVTNYKKDIRSAESSVTVWVASKDIPAGTSGSEVAHGFLTQQQVAKRSVTPGAIADPEQLGEQVAADTIYAGEQVTTRRFTSTSEQGIRSQISGNKRAIAVPGEAEQLLAGTLEDGDRVDIIGNWNFPEDKTRHVSRIVLRDILVLDAAHTQDSSEKITNPDKSAYAAILAVTDAQAQKLWWIVKNGDWSLQLRPATDAADSPESAESGQSMLLDGIGAAKLAALIAAEGSQTP